MKKSEVYKTAIGLVAKYCEGDELLGMLQVLMQDLELAEWKEAEAAKKEAEANG